MSILAVMRREPALVVGTVLALIGLVSAFGLGITDGQRDAIVALVGAVLALVGAAATRSQVSPAPLRRRGEAGAVDLLYLAVLVLVVLAIVALLAWLI